MNTYECQHQHVHTRERAPQLQCRHLFDDCDEVDPYETVTLIDREIVCSDCGEVLDIEYAD